MFDFAKQNLTLKGIGGGGVQGEMFEAVGGFNGTFHVSLVLLLLLAVRLFASVSWSRFGGTDEAFTFLKGEIADIVGWVG